MNRFKATFISILACTVISNVSYSEENIKIGFVGSLSSFAADYGSNVLDGVKLAVSELNENGEKVSLKIEDDQSDPKSSVLSYTKLTKVDKVDGIISGTWWANSFVQQAEHDNKLLFSCETLFEKSSVKGDTYFILQGDLREWVNVYEPLIQKEKGWKKGAIVRFVSGFADTLAAQYKEILVRNGREFVGDIEYSGINFEDAPSVILKLKKLSPDVIYVDAQPTSYANFLKKASESGLSDLAILGHTAGDGAFKDKAVDLSGFKNIYFLRRKAFDGEFAKRFKAKYNREPRLNSDLGYYSVYLFVEAMKSKDPVEKVRAGLTVQGRKFTFDKNNVAIVIPQDVYKVEGDTAVKVQ